MYESGDDMLGLHGDTQLSRLSVCLHAGPLLWRMQVTAICSRTEAEGTCDEHSGGCSKHSLSGPTPSQQASDFSSICVSHSHAFYYHID